MKISNRDISVVVLAIATLSGATVASIYGTNYYLFYPAIEQLQLGNPAMIFSATNSSLYGYSIFTIKNPTGYNGLTVLQFEPSFEVYSQNGTLIPLSAFMQFFPPKDSLSPGKLLSYNVSFVGSGPGVQEIYHCNCDLSLYSFNFTVAIFLSTFVDTYASLRTVYTCNTHIGGGICEQIAVLIKSTPTPSAGGGGV